MPESPSLIPIDVFEFELSAKASRWLDENSDPGVVVIAYKVTRCCGGTLLRDVRLRLESRSAHAARRLLRIGAMGGREVFLDSRLFDVMPRRIPVALRGVGRSKHLSLDLAGEQWARLLYS